MAYSNNKVVCIAGSSTEDKVEVKLIVEFLFSILSMAIKNISAAMRTTYVLLCFLDLLGFYSANLRNKEVIKVEQRPSVSPRHAPLLSPDCCHPLLPFTYVTRNNT